MSIAYEDWYLEPNEYPEPNYEASITFEVGHRIFSDSDEAISEAIRTGKVVYTGSDVYFDPKQDKI